MYKLLTIAMLLAACVFTSSAQENIGVITPNQRFVNQFEYDLFFMPREKVLEYMNSDTKLEFAQLKIERYKELVKNFEERIFLSDSATRIRKLEADFWHDKLLANDTLLEEEKKTNIQLRADVQNTKRSRFYYFIGGMVTTALIIGVFDND